MYLRLPVALLILFASAAAWAGDEDALSLADKAVMVTAQPAEWKMFTEGTYGEATDQGSGTHLHGERLSFDVHGDINFASGWRAILADRLDLDRLGGTTGDNNINTLKEAYVSWQMQPDRIADLGRINVRNGVGFGYNPTDIFRAYAVRSLVSIDPASLRENREGSIMLRGQTLWDSGSLTALYSPKLADQPNNAGFNPDVGATNQRDRWQIALSQKFTEQIVPQWLLSGAAGQDGQFGMNLTALPNNSTVAYLEWLGGRSPSLKSQAMLAPDDTTFRSRVATGFTYTTESNISFTAEYQYNGAGLDKAAWNALRSGSPLAYGLYREFTTNVLDLPTRQSLFMYASWTDAMIKHLDLTAMVRYDAVDFSRLNWAEARYHWTKVDLALQWQRSLGKPGSDYGALPQQTITQVVLRYFF